MKLVIGFALWMLPANRKRFPETRGRYPASTVWWSYWLLNLGLMARVIVEPAASMMGATTVTNLLLILMRGSE